MNDPTIYLHSFDKVQAVPVSWVLARFLARRKLTLLAGAPGTGKTTLAMAIAGCLSSGSLWADGLPVEQGNVLIWSGEDDPADTIKPRLMAAGADMSRVFFVGDVYEGDGEGRYFDPARDLTTLEEAAARIGNVSLLIADPVVSAVAGDSHKNTEVRRALQPLVNLASRLDCAVLGITHFSKGTAGRDPTERVTGSIAFAALARVVLVTAKGDDDERPRMLAIAKSNIGPDGGGFAYDLEQVEVSPGLYASRVKWGAALEGTARELLGDFEVSDSPRDDAASWLLDFLRDGSEKVGAIKAEARNAGFSWRTIERAKSELGITASRYSDGKDGSGYWAWALPPNPANPTSQDMAVLLKPSNDGGCSRKNPATPPNPESGGLVADLPAEPCFACAGEGCTWCEATP